MNIAIAPATIAADETMGCFKVVKYALTRHGAEGKIEFASRRGWTTDMAQADMRETKEQAPYSFSKDFAAEGYVSRIEMRVYEGDAMKGQTGDMVIVARDCDGMGTVSTGKPSFVTDTGIIGSKTEISDRVWQAVAYDPADIQDDMRRAEVGSSDQMAEIYGKRAVQPTHKIGNRHYIRPQQCRMAIRQTTVTPA